MAEILPEKNYPVPSPQPSKELLETSWGLDLTPERNIKSRERLRKSKVPGTSRDLNFYGEAPVLSVPQLNSTAVLSTKIQKLKQRSHHPDPSSADKKLPTPLSTVKENIADLEGVLHQKPVTEVNIPRHASRYSNLVSVDVPDMTFQKQHTTKSGKKSAARLSNKEESDQGPSLMELMTPDLEWEEADWSVDTTSYTNTTSYANTVESCNTLNSFPSSLYVHLYHS